MNDHPDILELELSRTGEADDATLRHLQGCEACQATVAELASLEAGLTPPMPPIAIPDAVDLAVAGAIEDAARRAEGGGEKAGTGEEEAVVLRPSRWRRALPILGGFSAAAAAMIFFLNVAGDNLRALTGASADALAGNESRSVNVEEQGTSLEGHKSLADFSEGGGGYAGEPPRDLPAALGASSPDARAPGQELLLGWAPTTAFAGTLRVRLALPPGATVERIRAARAADRLQHHLEAGRQLVIELHRDTESSELVQVQLELSGAGEDRPRLLSSRLTGLDGETVAVPLELGLR